MAKVAKVAAKLFLGAVAIATGDILLKHGAQETLNLNESYNG